MRLLAMIWLGFISFSFLLGCATCTMQPDGTVAGKAFGNAACSVCPRAAIVPKVGSDPIPSPIVPTVKDGCLVVNGGAETGNSVISALGIIFAFFAGKGL